MIGLSRKKMLSDSKELMRLRHWVKRKASPTLFSGLSANSSTKGPLLAEESDGFQSGISTSVFSIINGLHFVKRST